jgi:hypothetical protein
MFNANVNISIFSTAINATRRSNKKGIFTSLARSITSMLLIHVCVCVCVCVLKKAQDPSLLK